MKITTWKFWLGVIALALTLLLLSLTARAQIGGIGGGGAGGVPNGSGSSSSSTNGSGGGMVSNAFNLTFQKNTPYTNSTPYWAHVSQTFKALPNSAATTIFSFYVDTNADGVWDVININQTMNLGIVQEISMPFGGQVPPGGIFDYTNTSGIFTTLSPYTNSGSVAYFSTNGSSGGGSGSSIALSDVTNTVTGMTALTLGANQLSGIVGDYRLTSFPMAQNLKLPFLDPTWQQFDLRGTGDGSAVGTTNYIHSMIYVPGTNRYVFAFTQTYPAVMLRFLADDPTNYTAIPFANDGKHDWASASCYNGTNVFVLFTGTTNCRISKIDIESMAETALVDTNFPTGGNQALATDGRNLYVASQISGYGTVGKFRISDGVQVGSNVISSAGITDVIGKSCHAINFDGRDLFVTGFQSTPAWIAKVSTNDLSTITIRGYTNAAPFATFNYIHDDIADAGADLYLTGEAGVTTGSSQMLRVNKANMNDFAFIDTGLTNYGAYTIYFDGKYILAPFTTDLTNTTQPNVVIVRYDPQTAEMVHIPFPTNYYLLNELVGDGSRLFYSCYTSNSTVGRITIPSSQGFRDIWAGTNQTKRLDVDANGNAGFLGVISAPSINLAGTTTTGTNSLTLTNGVASRIAVGNFATAWGNSVAAIGTSSQAPGDNSVAIGFSSLSQGTNSLVVGSTSRMNSGNNSLAAGNTTYIESGASSITLGNLASSTANRTFIWSGNLTTRKTNSTAGSFQINVPSGINLWDSAISGNGSGLTNIPSTSITGGITTNLTFLRNLGLTNTMYFTNGILMRISEP